LHRLAHSDKRSRVLEVTSRTRVATHLASPRFCRRTKLGQAPVLVLADATLVCINGIAVPPEAPGPCEKSEDFREVIMPHGYTMPQIATSVAPVGLPIAVDC